MNVIVSQPEQLNENEIVYPVIDVHVLMSVFLGDEDGMIISGGVGCNWANFDWSTCEDEMNDEPTESNRVAVEKFYQFINGVGFICFKIITVNIK